MGYTHYWKSNGFTKEQWAELQTLARTIFERANDQDIAIQYESDDTRPPYISGEFIRFNGVGALGHETFLLEKAPTSFAFCKTARKDYDVVVVAILMAADIVSPEFEWRSDGQDEKGYADAGQDLLYGSAA